MGAATFARAAENERVSKAGFPLIVSIICGLIENGGSATKSITILSNRTFFSVGKCDKAYVWFHDNW
jgi:hypothetical protein